MGIRVAERPEGEPMRLAGLRAGSRLRLPDGCALDTALSADTTLATFDNALATAARERHVTVALDQGPEPGDPDTNAADLRQVADAAGVRLTVEEL